MPNSVIDETVLEGLRALPKEGQQGFPSKIVGLYLDTTPSVLKELDTAALAGDASVLQIASHRLSSASIAVGAMRLAALCNELEAMTRTGQVPADAAERIQAIADEYGRVGSALKQWCAARQ